MPHRYFRHDGHDEHDVRDAVGPQGCSADLFRHDVQDEHDAMDYRDDHADVLDMMNMMFEMP